MGITYEQDRLNSLLKDISDLQADNNNTKNALLVNVALVLKEAMESNDIASLKGLLSVLNEESISARDIIAAVIERQEKNLIR